MNTFFANQLITQSAKVMLKSKPTTVVRLSGPYAMFGQGRVIETVPNTTSKNGRISSYKITSSKTSNFGMGRYGDNTVQTTETPQIRLFEILNNSTRYKK